MHKKPEDARGNDVNVEVRNSDHLSAPAVTNGSSLILRFAFSMKVSGWGSGVLMVDSIDIAKEWSWSKKER
jgi:hypothetical protein